MDAESQVFPDDSYNRELLANTHPPDWHNPAPAPRYNLVVIGAGTAGIVAATGAGALGAKVALVEQNLLGGDCLVTGCVPSKSLIHSARVAHEVCQAAQAGVEVAGEPEVDFAAVMERMRRLRARISHHESVEHFRTYNVELFFGAGCFRSPDSIEVGGQVLTFKKAIIATGARSAHPPIDGLEEAGFLTNESVFSLTARPPRLAIIGGGPIGCEMAQAFCRLGSQVTLFHNAGHILNREDPAAAAIVQQAFLREGICLVLNATISKVAARQGAKLITWSTAEEGNHETNEVEVDAILVGTGRAPNVENLTLEAADVRYNLRTGVEVNSYLQTSNPNIYAAGDVCLAHKFTHAADASARIALQNALFLGRKKQLDLTIPRCTFTDPQIAHVGMHAHDAEQQGIATTTFRVDLQEIDRAVVDGDEEGFAAIYVKRGSDRILGATVVSRQAGEIINELTLAIVGGIGMNKLNRVIHPYPVQAEVIRRLTDNYSLTRLTPLLHRLVKLWLRITR